LTKSLAKIARAIIPANHPSYMRMHAKSPVFPDVTSFYFCLVLSSSF
jgi:hypothetical protein